MKLQKIQKIGCLMVIAGIMLVAIVLVVTCAVAAI